MTIVCSAIFKDGVLVPDWKLDLVEGADYVVTVGVITEEERARMISEHNRQIEKLETPK
ncbi:MAG TPA: hypothetical protein VHM90_21065 [Phycisphaerae bacterium]|nr:hypothetical protein [Phycisphaerae bacterium]